MIERLTALADAHSRRTLVAAGLVFALAAALGSPVVSLLKSESSDFQDPHAQSQRLIRAIEDATGQASYYGVAALVSGRRDVRSDPGAERQVARVVALLSRQRGFQRALDYQTSHLPLLVSRDGRKTLVLVAFATRELSAQAVQHVRARLTRASPGGSRVAFGGNDVAFHEIDQRTSSDLARAETLALPLLLALSFLVFRGLVAATLPLLVGGFAIVLTFLLLRLVDQALGLSIFAVNLVTGMGLGLGIDYSLFVLSRYREERARDADARAAIARTLQTAGRTVLYSSLTVAGALACLLVFPLRFLYSMGIGGALVALCAGAVSLIVLPAVLVVLGPRVDALAPARLQRAARPGARADGAWSRLARAVMRRPGAVALLTAAALALVALPSLGLSLAPADARVLPGSSETRRVAETITRDFAADGSQTITVLARAPASAAVAMGALATAAQRLAARQASLGGPPRYLGRGRWEIDLLPHGTAGAHANQRLVERLRALAARRYPATRALVGGTTAWFVDQKAAIAAHAPLALAILALVTGGFLFLMTGSLVLPALALVMNLLTVSVGAGLLVEVFQHGHLSKLLGFTPIGGLEESNLVLLFVVAFALSTDYGVFLFARIKEGHDRGLATRDAVVHGLERTGRLITAAALLFCVAIGAFVRSHIFFVKQLGFGGALAVVIDATVVRALLVPALMGWLGERTWWAPRPLRALHVRLGLRESAPSSAPRPARGA
jgi:putative drug exporter of the RND superfamily